MIKYCCKLMGELDKLEIMDYCVPNLTTLDINGSAYPIYFCPFCGKKIKGSKEFVKRLKSQVKGIRSGKIKTIPLEELGKTKKEKK